MIARLNEFVRELVEEAKKRPCARITGGEFVRRFPADMVTRTLASISRMPEVPFGWPQPPLPGFHDRFYALRQPLLEPLYGLGLSITVASILVVLLARPQKGLFLLFVFAFVAGCPSI